MNETKQIDYFRKNVYGNDLMYVADRRTAQLIQRLTGKQTLREQDIATFNELGFTFKEVLAPRNP